MKLLRPADYADKLECLIDLQTLDYEGHIDLFYGDESGFSLVPVVPYGWQPPDSVVERPSRYSPRVNVLSWLNEAGQCVSYYREQSIDSGFVVASISQWVASLSKPTVLVLDNAPIHRSKRFQAELAGWQTQGLYVFFLPAYSPHLNKAEILWRKIKYEWLDISAYASYESLKSAVQHILANFGQEYQIRFAQKHCLLNYV